MHDDGNGSSKSGHLTACMNCVAIVSKSGMFHDRCAHAKCGKSVTPYQLAALPVDQ
jgi:hypothetical protein